MDAEELDPVTLVGVDRSDAPGCITITSIDAMDHDEVLRIDELAGEIVSTLVEVPDHLGTLFATTPQGRHFALAAWTSVEAVDRLKGSAHDNAMREFFGGTLGARVATSVWVPHRLNAIWTRDEKGRPQRNAPGSSPWL